ncbi:MAG: protein-methionine-sulfoxide reductase catalytic subunit MsrP [Prochlorotrichaceae cyanobacterium]
MPYFRIPPAWSLPESHATAESAYFTRRQVLKGLLGISTAIVTPTLVSCEAKADRSDPLQSSIDRPPLRNYRPNPTFAELDRPLTDPLLAGQYNNFYEFGGTKSIWQAAQALPLDPWTVEVGGLVNNPKTYDLDDLKRSFDLEERLYRFRCVEAWSMALPWLGFPMRQLVAAVDPKPQAKFVRFTSFYDPEVTPGPGFFAGFYPWPYTEALTLEEMNNELAFFAVGIYGRLLPKQHGAPLRAVLPWKYGFKGAKSIVKIEFTSSQPATFWNTVQPREYAFESNVDPSVPHPRWSQAEERFISEGPNLTWTMRPTLPYNGYGEFVADLYQG